MGTLNDMNLKDVSNAMADAVERAGESLVMVDARRRLAATGIACAPDLVITASHVVENEDAIRVGLADGSVVPASLAGRDPGRGLALLRLESPLLKPAVTSQEAVRVGQLVMAVARPDMDGLQASLGTLTALGGPVRTRPNVVLENYLRTDIVPMPGFSGGALINTAGEVVALVTSGLAPGTLIGLPAGLVWNVSEALAKHGKMRQPYLGIRSQVAALAETQQQALGREQATALVLMAVEEDSPAAAAGLMTGDLLVGVAGKPAGEHDDLHRALALMEVGQELILEILRGSEVIKVTVTLAEMKPRQRQDGRGGPGGQRGRGDHGWHDGRGGHGWQAAGGSRARRVSEAVFAARREARRMVRQELRRPQAAWRFQGAQQPGGLNAQPIHRMNNRMAMNGVTWKKPGGRI